MKVYETKRHIIRNLNIAYLIGIRDSRALQLKDLIDVAKQDDRLNEEERVGIINRLNKQIADEVVSVLKEIKKVLNITNNNVVSIINQNEEYIEIVEYPFPNKEGIRLQAHYDEVKDQYYLEI